MFVRHFVRALFEGAFISVVGTSIPTFVSGSIFASVKESTVSEKFGIIRSFKSSDMTLVHGDLYDHESLVKVLKQVDVVISTVSHAQLQNQVKIIAAIK